MPHQLRIALFSGNYNYVRDGANQALNRLVAYLERRGVEVRVYSPIAKTAAFEPAGTLVPVPSLPIPGRSEYRFALGLPPAIRRDLERFNPTLLHLSAPDWLGHAAKAWGKSRDVPVVASVHTRFETYFDYYRLGFLRLGAEALLRRFYGDMAEIYAPSKSMAAELRRQGMSRRIGIWSRGVDRSLYAPSRRDLDWRRARGMSNDDVVIGFVGRLVLEKGLDVLASTAEELTRRGIRHRVMVVGDGPAREWVAPRLPDAVFTGFLRGQDLARAYASSDVLFNPSVTETFGNVTLEALASGLPVVAARATGSRSLVDHGRSGMLVEPGDISGYADALTRYLEDPAARAAAGAAGLLKSSRYDWDRINDALLARYLRIVGPPVTQLRPVRAPFHERAAALYQSRRPLGRRWR